LSPTLMDSWSRLQQVVHPLPDILKSNLIGYAAETNLSEVLQAHLPGNYQLVDEPTGWAGEGICKGCWESGRAKTSTGLETVWVSVEGANLALWLCKGHADSLKLTVLKRESGAISSPEVRA
jgi:hypothetical protein